MEHFFLPRFRLDLGDISEEMPGTNGVHFSKINKFFMFIVTFFFFLYVQLWWRFLEVGMAFVLSIWKVKPPLPHWKKKITNTNLDQQ